MIRKPAHCPRPMYLHVQVLKSVKAATELRNSVSHSAIIFANALMHCGTTVDSFLRDNLDWLSRATNWAKFSATAGLGVIHRGHLAEVKVTYPIFSTFLHCLLLIFVPRSWPVRLPVSVCCLGAAKVLMPGQ